MRGSLHLFLLLPLFYCVSCQTADTGTASRSGGGDMGQGAWNAGHGLQIRKPPYSGQFDAQGAEEFSWFFATSGSLAAFGRSLYVGDVELDDPAMTSAILGPTGASFPSQNVSRLQPITVDGQRMLLFQETVRNEAGEVLRLHAGVRNGPWLYSFFALSLPSKDEQAGVLGQERAANFWRYISLTEPPQVAPQSIDETERGFSSEALMHVWGSYIQRGKFSLAQQAAEQGMEIAPDPAPWAEAIAQTYVVSRDFEKGVEELTKLLERFPGDTSLMWRKAYFLRQLGRTDEAIALYRAAVIAGDERSQDAVVSFFNLLLEEEVSDQYLDEMRAVAASLPQNPMVQALLAHALFRADKTEELEAVIAELERMSAYIPSAAELLAEIYLTQEDFDAALRIAERVRDEFKQPAGNYLAGWALFASGRYSEAREQLQLAVKAMPGHAEAQRLLELSSSMLGKADTSFLRQEIEPVPLPEGLVAQLPEPAEDLGSDYGVYSPYRGKMFNIGKGRRLRSTEYFTAVVLDRKALERVNEFVFPFDPLWERIHVNYLRVYDAGGALIHEGSIDDYYLANNEEQGILATQRRQLHVPVGGAQVGARIEIAVSKETLAPQSSVTPMHEVLSGDFPIQLSFIGLRGDLEDVDVETRGAVTDETLEDGQLRVLSISQPRVFPIAHNLPPPREFLPVVWIGAAGQSWEKQALDYYERTKDHFEPAPEVVAKVGELLGDDRDPAHAVAVLTDFVRDALTYQAIEFGVRAQIPNSCAQILSNRYGDCKDHTFLLMQLLRAAGVSAYPALVDNRLQLNTDLPDINQFNHVIVYLPDFQGGQFIDATEKYVPLGSIPYGLGGEPALIVDPENPRLVDLPDYPVDASKVAIDRSMSLSGEGVLTVNEEVRLSGFVAAWARASLAHVPEAEAPIVLSEVLAIPAFQHITNLGLHNFDDREQPLRITYSYELPRQFVSVGDIIAGRLPGTWESIYLRQPPEDSDRWAPIWQRQPIVVDSNISVDLPSNFTLSDQNNMEPREISSQFCTYRTEPSLSQHTLSIHSTFTSGVGIFPPTTYHERRNIYQSASNLSEHPLLLHRTK